MIVPGETSYGGAEGENPLLATGAEALRQKYWYETGLWRVSHYGNTKGEEHFSLISQVTRTEECALLGVYPLFFILSYTITGTYYH